MRQKDLCTQRWSYVVFKNIYSILSSFKLHLSVKHSTHWRSLNPKPVQFELISVFLQKNTDSLFFLQSNWWPCIDHLHFLYLTGFCLFAFQTSACFTDGYRVLSIPFHTRKSNFKCQMWPKSPLMPTEPYSEAIGRVWEDKSHHDNPSPGCVRAPWIPLCSISTIYPTENFSQSTEWESWLLPVIVCSKLVLQAKAFRLWSYQKAKLCHLNKF